MVAITAKVPILTLVPLLGLALGTSFSNGTYNGTSSTAANVLSASSESHNAKMTTSQHIPSTRSTSSADFGIRAFIASGLGMTQATDAGDTGSNADSTDDATTATKDSPTILEASYGNVACNTSNTYSQYRNMTFTEDCWDQWKSFWAASTFLATQDQYI
jgi:hypothetical protein